VIAEAGRFNRLGIAFALWFDEGGGHKPDTTIREHHAMSIQIRPLHEGFVGEVAGIDLAQPLAPGPRGAIRDAIEAGMDRYGVLVFHD